MIFAHDLYDEILFDHNHYPRNYPKHPENANCSAHGSNPLCGDELQVHISLEDNFIRDIGFEGFGCAVCIASASMMTEAMKGKTVAEAEILYRKVHDVVNTYRIHDEYFLKVIEKLNLFAGISRNPTRIQCITLSWELLFDALDNESVNELTEKRGRN